MRIGFDGKRAVRNLTGLGNYSRLVIESMASEMADWDFFVYVSELRENPRLAGIKALENVEFRFPGPVSFGGGAWRTFGVTNHLSADGVEIYHGLSNELPLNIRSAVGVKSVVTIHDVIYRRLPHCYNAVDRLVYDFKYGHSARNADRVIAISECTKRDVMEYYGVPEDRIDVVYQGCDDIFKLEPDVGTLSDVRRRYALPERYIVQVGTVEWRKNLALSAAALSGLPDDVCLLAVGRDRKGYKREVMEVARRYGVADRIIWPGNVAFQDLPSIYRLSQASVLPSHYEGFGIPVIEAMECGVPFVGAKGSCLEEAGGDSGYYVDPNSVEEMTETLRMVLEGGEDISRRVRAGREYVKRFDNASMARNILDVYKKLV